MDIWTISSQDQLQVQSLGLSEEGADGRERTKRSAEKNKEEAEEVSGKNGE